MDTNYDNTVLDFDLNFFHQGSNSLVPNKIDKQKKALLIVKRKTIATDSLIRKFYGKRQVLEHTEKCLAASKNECKQVCINYNNALEKCSQLEMSIQELEHAHLENKKKLVTSENHLAALKSHTIQLQQLTRENETLIEALKIENQLEKSNSKNNEKKIVSLQNTNETVSKHLQLAINVLFGKKKLRAHHKELLKKYTNNNLDNNNLSFESDHSDRESVGDENAPTNIFSDDQDSYIENQVPFEKQLDKDFKKTRSREIIDELDKKADLLKDDIDHDSDCNEIVSVDTGRASSLASTDSLRSPDYYTEDHSIALKVNEHVYNKKQTNSIATSPMTIIATCHSATSPIMFEVYQLNEKNSLKDAATSPIIFQSTTTRNKLLDKGTSPMTINISDLSNDCKEQNSSDQNYKNKECMIVDISKNMESNNCGKKSLKNVAISPVIFDTIINDSPQTPNNSMDRVSTLIFDSARVPSIPEENNSEQIGLVKECLELNNSENISDKSSDIEIQMILDSMRITHKLITPIPKTPLKSSVKKRCKEAAKVREENKVLHLSIAELAKEVIDIKSLLTARLLKDHFSEHNNFKKLDNTDEQSIIDNNSDRKRKQSNLLHYENEQLQLFEKTYEHNVNNSYQLNRKENNMLHCKSSVCDEPELFKNAAGQIETTQNSDTEKEDVSPCIVSTGEKPQPNIFTSKSLSVDPPVEDTVVPNDNASGKIQVRPRKLTKLDKLRKTMLPRFKIPSVESPTKKAKFMKKKPITVDVKVVLNRVKESDYSATMNDRNAYEKAIKVMTELKTKQKLNVVKNVGNKINKIYSKPINIVKEVRDSEKIDFTNRLSPPRANNSKINKNYSKPVNSFREVKDSEKNDFNNRLSLPLTNNIITRSQRKGISDQEMSPCKDKQQNIGSNNCKVIQEKRNRKRRLETGLNQSENRNKRMLRSSTNQRPDESLQNSNDTNLNVSANNQPVDSNNTSVNDTMPDAANIPSNTLHVSPGNIIRLEPVRDNVAYDNLDMFIEIGTPNVGDSKMELVKQSIFCKMLEKYAIVKLKRSGKKESSSIINSISKTIEDRITEITELSPDEARNAMDEFADNIKAMNMNQFLMGLMEYLKSPDRKNEFYNKIIVPAAPPLTKSEQVLLYVVKQLKTSRPNVDILNYILNNIEYVIFKINGTPDFNTIETMSHFYAVLCRYFRQKSRLRLFMLDALYCIQFKAIPLIKQCLDVWMHILPLAHMGIAKCPLVTCLVYLLNFYKCDDSRNRVQDIKNILSRRYFYNISDWNETKILENLRSSILELKNNSLEVKSLRMALIILAKRSGARWCQNKIIKKLLLPLIEKTDVPERVTRFCVSALGPLMKPYPNDMKIHCEVVINHLIDMLAQNPSPLIQEAIFTSLLYMTKHNNNKVIKALLSWKPNEITPEFEELLQGFIREKPAKSWQILLSKLQVNS